MQAHTNGGAKCGCGQPTQCVILPAHWSSQGSSTSAGERARACARSCATRHAAQAVSAAVVASPSDPKALELHIPRLCWQTRLRWWLLRRTLKSSLLNTISVESPERETVCASHAASARTRRGMGGRLFGVWATGAHSAVPHVYGIMLDYVGLG